MLSFHPLALEDKQWIDEYVFAFGSRSADFNFGSMFMWDGRYCQQVCSFGGRLVVMAQAHGVPVFPFPIGTGELAPVIDELRSYARQRDIPLIIRGIERQGVEQLDEIYPGKFVFTDDREYSDYIYLTEKLATLSGKKLHAKRNYVNRFCAENQWGFRPLTPELFPACLELLRRWRLTEPHYLDCTVSGEHNAILRGFENYDALGLMGGALFSGGKLIAFTVGELACADTVDVHFEKADADIPGAYAMINCEFAKYIAENYPHVKYMNREDDMGLDNLRQSKLSYHPEMMVEKYTAHWCSL